MVGSRLEALRPHAPETRHAGRARPETGTRWDPSGSTQSVQSTDAEAVGAPTRSPMKLAAAPPWPDTSEMQRETVSDDNYFDKHRSLDTIFCGFCILVQEVAFPCIVSVLQT